ncbi:MAG: VacJ family lipoprotein [Terrimicrobiaceae bacterium]|nr:VacJ family lipoprotein [Terrimicrobiaceae bacterium]
MKSLLPILLAIFATFLTSCSSTPRKPPSQVSAPAGKHASDGKSVASQSDDLDEYDVASVSDPIEPINRVTFVLNHGIYTIILRPISKGYEFVIPKPVRRGIYNAYENVKFPVRVINDLLQWNLKRAGLETGKFFVNSTIGVGGIGRPSDHIPALADVPAADTGQTFAKWGIGNGPYIVLPLLGPSTLRDAVGLAGDYALNPITWVSFVYGHYGWIIAIPTANTMRALPGQLALYDTITKGALDRYLAARSAYIQYRREAALK